jgi:hypothetical protein
MIQLVDPDTRIRIDVFPDFAGSIADARATQIGEHWMQVLRHSFQGRADGGLSIAGA